MIVVLMIVFSLWMSLHNALEWQENIAPGWNYVASTSYYVKASLLADSAIDEAFLVNLHDKGNILFKMQIPDFVDPTAQIVANEKHASAVTLVQQAAQYWSEKGDPCTQTSFPLTNYMSILRISIAGVVLGEETLWRKTYSPFRIYDFDDEARITNIVLIRMQEFITKRFFASDVKQDLQAHLLVIVANIMFNTVNSIVSDKNETYMDAIDRLESQNYAEKIYRTIETMGLKYSMDMGFMKQEVTRLLDRYLHCHLLPSLREQTINNATKTKTIVAQQDSHFLELNGSITNVSLLVTQERGEVDFDVIPILAETEVDEKDRDSLSYAVGDRLLSSSSVEYFTMQKKIYW